MGKMMVFYKGKDLQTGHRQLLKGRRENRTAESGRCGEPYVTGHNKQDIRRPLGRGGSLGKVRCGLRGRAADLSFEWLWSWGRTSCVNAGNAMTTPSTRLRTASIVLWFMAFLLFRMLPST